MPELHRRTTHLATADRTMSSVARKKPPTDHWPVRLSQWETHDGLAVNSQNCQRPRSRSPTLYV